MRPVRSKGMNLSRWSELDYKEIEEETNAQLGEGGRLGELAKQFSSDKTKLEDEIDKVQNSKISEEDKAKIIDALNTAVDMLQDQYDDDVAAEEAKVQEEIEIQLEQMDEAIDEYDQQIDSLNSVPLDVAKTDTSDAINEAEEKKQEFIRMKNENSEKLKLQMEQAEIMYREMRARRLSGR